MFKSLFKKNYDETFLKVVEVAYDKRNYISKMFEPLELDNQLELFLFNSVMAFSYMINNKIIHRDEKLLTRYLSTVCVFADEIKKLPEEQLFKLIYDRIENYGQELNLVANSKNSNNEHFPLYFYRRIYHYPLELNEMPEIQEWDNEYYQGSALLDIYIHQVNAVKERISEVL